MNVRLAGGVVPPAGSGLWLAAPAGGSPPSGAPADDAPPGAPVAVGPADAPVGHVRDATRALAGLVAAGGPLAAGAGADLGHGFFSARLDGGRGDRRDCLLAALRTDLSRLGPPAALLAGLFGPRATKRVGAAARIAIEAGRWPVLRFAAAASDVLGPEQLERLLATTPEEPAPAGGSAAGGSDPFGEGLASDVAVHLERLLAGFSAPRRATLLTDLWRQAAADSAAKLAADRLRGTQRDAGGDDLTARYRRLDDDVVLAAASFELDGDPRPAQLARWRMPPDLWVQRLQRMMEDALATTVLCRIAADSVTAGLRAAVERHFDALAFAGGMPGGSEVTFANRAIPGLTVQPGRPALWAREIVRLVRRRPSLTPKVLAEVERRVARARDWGEVVMFEIEETVWVMRDVDVRAAVGTWGEQTMADWRAAAGYSSPERLPAWNHRRALHLGDAPGRTPLSGRGLGDERIDDLFWLGELADQVARLHGHPAAEITFERAVPEMTWNRFSEPDPFVPPAGPVTAAVTAAAQLAELGGSVPDKPRTWAELAAGLFGTASVAEALTGVFTVPAELTAADGTTVPDTDLRVEVARTGRRLAEWGAFMGNCIGGDYYIDRAGAGRSMLVALRGPDGRIVLNAELVRRPTGWGINEIRARFNDDPDPGQERAVRRWASRLAPPSPPPEADYPQRTRDSRKGSRPRPAARTLRESGPELRARLAGARVDDWVRVAALLPGRAATMTGTEAVIALRRVSITTLTVLCRDALAHPEGPDLHELWRASGNRPLRDATTGADAGRLAPLAEDAPLPGHLRALARVPEIRAARAADLVALRTRLALGRLIRDDDPRLARHLRDRPARPLLCAMALAATALHPSGVVVTPPGSTEVPGFPATDLAAGVWLSARGEAAELGGVPDRPDDGLRVPSSWIPRGWAALWARAARHRPGRLTAG